MVTRRRGTTASRAGVIGALLVAGVAALAARQTARPAPQTPAGEWRYIGGDAAQTRYSPLDQITAANFETLQTAWTWRGDNYGPEVDFVSRSTPLYVDGVLYTVAGSRRTVVAIDPGTGETLWTYREPPTTRLFFLRSSSAIAPMPRTSSNTTTSAHSTSFFQSLVFGTKPSAISCSSGSSM